METITPGFVYNLLEIGRDEVKFKRITFPKIDTIGAVVQSLHMLLDRTTYLNNVLPCVETRDAIEHLLLAISACKSSQAYPIRVLDPGHIYELWRIDNRFVRVRFIKRSGGAVRYTIEWPGTQSQEVIRALIAYATHHHPELEEVVQELRMTLFMYEVRAYRRKQEKVNRKAPTHDDEERPHSWRENPFSEVPFNEVDIEKRQVDPQDGHIIL